MREIKFRGKSKKDGEWFYGNLYDKDNTGRTHICTTSKGCLDIDPDTVGQFTGLFDKNGKEIYEGDLVKIDEIFPILLEVYYNAEKGSFCLAEYTHTQGVIKGSAPLGSVWESYPSMEVIGNIHDNPELMKGVEK